jgi:DNA (cytosine-5)-methyltransferase 1
MGAYYNENDPTAAAWLRQLITEGLITDGEVDIRSITDVQPADLVGFSQCHFFAGIGGWSYALQLAGWPDDRPVWTGSCPCQPFSTAGAKAGGDDSRHLWPAWFRLIRECRPDTVFGEQVESAITHGWIDLVSDDLEREGYAVGAVGLPACSVGAPHIRQRLWFVANTEGAEQSRHNTQKRWAVGHSQSVELADAERSGVGYNARKLGVPESEETRQQPEPWGLTQAVINSGTVGELAESDGRNEPQERTGDESRGEQSQGWRPTIWARTGTTSRVGELAEPNRRGQCERGERDSDTVQPTVETPQWHDAGGCGDAVELGHANSQREGQIGGVPRGPRTEREGSPWADLAWLPCRDGKARPTQPGLQPLVTRLPSELVPSGDPSESYSRHSSEARVMRLRGYGNSINTGVAVAFVECYMETRRQR